MKKVIKISVEDETGHEEFSAQVGTSEEFQQRRPPMYSLDDVAEEILNAVDGGAQ